MQQYHEYRVWDAPTRIFHWVNAITVILLIFVGFIILFRNNLGFTGSEVKLALKSLHSLIGYIFVINLLLRLVWAFAGNAYARWGAFLPTGSTMRRIGPYLAALRQGRPQHYAGHNPAARLALTLIYLVLLMMAITGLIRAGTDLYYPPLGGLVAEYVAADGVDPDTLVAGDKTGTDKARYDQVSKYKIVFGIAHEYGAYIVLLLAILHIFAVVISEKREGDTLVSAMITGRKILRGEAVDAGKPRDE